MTIDPDMIGEMYMVTPKWGEEHRRVGKVLGAGKNGADYRMQFLDDGSIEDVNMFRLKKVSPLQALGLVGE